MANDFLKDISSIKLNFFNQLNELEEANKSLKDANARIKELESETHRLREHINQVLEEQSLCTCREYTSSSSQKSDECEDASIDATYCSNASSIGNDVVPESPTNNDFKPLRDLRERTNKQTTLNSFFTPPKSRTKWRKMTLNKRPLENKENRTVTLNLDKWIKQPLSVIKKEKMEKNDISDDLLTQINESILNEQQKAVANERKKEADVAQKRIQLIKIKAEPESPIVKPKYDLNCTECTMVYKFRGQKITKEIYEEHARVCENFKRKMENPPDTPDGFWDIEFQNKNQERETLIDYRRLEDV